MKDVIIPRRKWLAVATLYSTTLAWFYLFYAYIFDKVLFVQSNSPFLLNIGKVVFFVSVVASGFVGSLLSEKVSSRKFLSYWIAFGILSTASLAFFAGTVFAFVISICLGASFGLCFPLCQAILTTSTSIEERGRVAGITIFFTFVLVVGILIPTTVLNFGVLELVLMSIGLKVAGIVALFLDPLKRESGRIESWFTVLTAPNFASYLVPWLIFQVANGIFLFVQLPPSVDLPSISTIGLIIEYIGTILAALISGFLADYFGRKQPILAGLLMLGISYAMLALATNSFSFLILMLAEGVAWGLIAVSYMQVVIGDISTNFGSKEKFYLLGGMVIPFLIKSTFSLIQESSQFTIAASALSPLLSIVLFVSVVPVWRAMETLPMAKIRERKLRKHVEKISKIVLESKD